jgi:hypothetical protein
LQSAYLILGFTPKLTDEPIEPMQTWGDQRMRKPLLLSLAAVVAASAVLWIGTPEAKAIKQFKDEFEAVYILVDDPTPEQEALALAVEEVRCNVCHEGRSKRNRNIYGQALSELLDRKEDKEDVEKIRAALIKVEAISSDPDADDAPTFGELIEAGKLPGGEEEE